MATDKVILHGGGEHARVVLDSLQAAAVNVIALFDPKYQGELFGVQYRGPYDPTFEPDAKAIVAIGDNAVRKNVVAKMMHAFTNAIHPSAIVSSRATYGVGNMILHGVIIQAQAIIGNHCILNTGVKVDHDCHIADYVHLGPGVTLCGTVSVGEGSFVGGSAVVIPGKKIGAGCTVGAGTVVIDDVPDHAVVVGNPGRIIKYQAP